MSPEFFLLLLGAVGFVAHHLPFAHYNPAASFLDLQDSDFGAGVTGLSADDTSVFHGIADVAPAFNMDGTTMLGAVHTNGDPYGLTQNHDSFIDQGEATHTMFDIDPFDHSFNIDGTPMLGDIDIHGNPFGVIESDTWSSNGLSSSSMFD